MQLSHLIVPLVGAGLVGLAVLAYRGHVRMQADATAIDATLVEEYCRLVAEERYAEAYERCLTREYRGRIPPERFAQVQRERRAEHGALQGRKLVTLQASRNLFSGTRSFVLQYQLQYPAGPRPGFLSVSDADGPMRVEGTYIDGAGGESLDVEYW